jgi:hypothetical protein
MATPGELVRTIADALGIPVATVVQHDRNLAAAGLRTKGGRGPSAAHVTSQDAANLLIAICGAPISGATVKESCQTWTRYGSLRAHGVNIKASNFRRLKNFFPTLARLPDRHTFADAIATLIDSIASREFDDPRISAGYQHVSVGFKAPRPRGSITVNRLRRVQMSYQQSDEWRVDDSDFRQERSFGLETLTKIAEVVGTGAERLREPARQK